MRENRGCGILRRMDLLATRAQLVCKPVEFINIIVPI